MENKDFIISKFNPWNMFQAIEPTTLGLEKHLKITSELSRTI